MSEEKYQRKLRQARATYVERARVEAAQVRALRQRRDEAAMTDLRQLAHKVNGTAGTFGYRGVSAIAEQLETAVDSGEATERISELADELARALETMKVDQ